MTIKNSGFAASFRAISWLGFPSFCDDSHLHISLFK